MEDAQEAEKRAQTQTKVLIAAQATMDQHARTNALTTHAHDARNACIAHMHNLHAHARTRAHARTFVST